MELVKPKIEFKDMNNKGLKLIEEAGRTCYKSENKIKEGTDEIFAKKIIKNNHEAILEFGWACYRIICNRGVTHELIRHRLFSFAQESTRYCNYKGGIQFIIPYWSEKITEGKYNTFDINKKDYNSKELIWLKHKLQSEDTYQNMLKLGQTPQDARDNLPIATKTEIVVAGNFREWRHFFSLRLPKNAHPQIREISPMILEDITKRIPVVFDEFLK